ncbi:MAG: flagellar hook-length control protein FliK [SAR324 cluster bacterium]|nr:flagellar hook-length control protein FliK [SAR324 cluster bacterium]
MMEPIGQKAVMPTTEEAIVVASELEADSGESGEDGIFDTTLKEMLAEIPLEENLLEELLDEDGLSASLNSAILTQNQLDTAVVDANFGAVDSSTMPLEMLGDDLWKEDLSSLKTQVLQKSTPIATELIEVLDPRFAIEESNFEILPEKGIAETGLQTLLQESDTDSSGSLLQSVFHNANPSQAAGEFSADNLQNVLQKNVSQSIQLGPGEMENEAEFTTSDLKIILQKTASQSFQLEGEYEISKSDLLPETQKNTVQPLKLQDDNVLVQDLKSVLKNQEESLQEDLQTVFRHGSQEEAEEFEKLGDDNLQKLKRAEVPLTPEKIKLMESLQIVEKFKATDEIQVTVKSEETKNFQGKVKNNNIEGLQVTDKFKVTEEFRGGTISKVAAGFQATEKFKVAEEFLGGAKEKTAEGLQVTDKFKVAEEFLGGAKSKVATGFQATEKFKVTEEFQSGVKSKVAEGFQMTGIENTGDISEKASIRPLNQFRTLESNETQLTSNAKSTMDSATPSAINSLSEVSGTSLVKGGETTKTAAEILRGTDLPFNMEQVVSRVRILRGNGVEEMTLRLHPEDLGQITLKIRQSGGELSIDMRVDNFLAKQLVESGFDALRSKLLDQDFSNQDLALNVDINERDAQYSGNRNNSEFEEDLFSAERGRNEEVAAVEETPRTERRTDSGLNLYV